ncbi:MAG: hypothetical protein LBS01_03770 [Prevotellaceae bacterium]|nr:hypothetical protein [Prevotellaceae bacterium]
MSDKRKICFIYAESRKTTKFIELCATFVSFVVNFSTTRHNKTCPAKAGEIHKGHKTCPAKAGE